MTVGEICKRNVAVAVENETIIDAANHMRTAHVGDLVVIETRQNRRMPVGIITDRDIVVGAVAANAHHLDTLVVGDIMSPEPATVRPRLPGREGPSPGFALHRTRSSDRSRSSRRRSRR